jgi:uncharacterized membrane protein YdjX (TVP38/TMEM64 family)
MNALTEGDHETRLKTVWDYAKPVAEILPVLLIAAIGRIVSLHYLDIDAIATLRGIIAGFGVLAPLAFIALTALFVLIPLPNTIPVVVGALAFGSLSGACYSLLALTAGSCVAFFLGRYFLNKPAINLKDGRLKHTLEKMHGLLREHGFLTLLGLRLVFFANVVLNYWAGSTSVRFRAYLGASCLGIAPKVLVFSYLFNVLEQPNWSWNVLADANSIFLVTPPVIRLSGMVVLSLLSGVNAREAKRRNHVNLLRGEQGASRRGQAPARLASSHKAR